MSEEVKKDIGRILKQEREKRAIALDVVHETTKIPMDSLRAIEEGYKICTLTAFYYRNFVKLYAQYLKMDVDVVLADLNEGKPKDPVESARSAVKEPPSVSMQLFSNSARDKIVRKVIQVGGFVLMAVIAAALIVGGLRACSSKEARPVTVKKVEAKKPSQVQNDAQQKKDDERKKSAMIAAQKAKEAAAKQTEEVAALSQNKNASLAVKALQKVWLTVNYGVTVFQGNLSKGATETWSAKKKLELTGRGLDEIEYEVNGKMIGRLSRQGSIKKVLITPDGLTVGK